MTTPEDSPAPPPGFSANEPPGDAPASDDERRLFALLERYVDSLESGDLDSRSGLIERHPDAARLMRCLELLDRLAPEPSAAPPGRASADAAPQSFGRYELVAEIGRGGMGVVFRARQVDLDRFVALKMILANRLASADDVRRFQAEARAAASLRHPNIVGIHDVGEVHGQPFFTMDFVEGRSLAQALADGPFEPRQAARLAAAVARAVQYLHEHQIVHRDLKPSNILLSAENTPYVTDFGLAKALAASSAETQTGTIVGTLGYMAPEQAAGKAGAASPASDVYSLGAVLFEMLTGRRPFHHSSPLDMLLDVIEGQPPRPTRLNPNVPLPLEWICLKCLERDPRKRYGSARALFEDLERFLRGEPPRVGPPGPVRALVRWGRREPALAAHLGGIAAAAAVVQVKYMISGFDWPYHLKIMGLFGAWSAAAACCNWMMRRVKRPSWVQFAWAAADAAFLTRMLYVADDPLGPLLVGYPLLIVAAGLFFRVRLVTFMTVACVLSYGVLVATGRDPVVKSHYTLIYATALLVTGVVVGYQAQRVRALTAYFDDGH